MALTSPRQNFRGLDPIPLTMPSEEEHRTLIARGLIAVQDRSLRHPIEALSVSATYSMCDIDLAICANATAAAITVNLLTAAGREGRRIVVKKTDSSANAVTVDAAGSETMDAAATRILPYQYDAIELVSNGTNWEVLSRVYGASASAGFTAGSVIFAGTNGSFTQDNANLFWDDTNNRLGIGTTGPVYDVHLKKSSTGNIDSTIENSNSGNAAAARLILISGLANSSCFFQVNNNSGSPYVQLGGGSAITAFYLDCAPFLFRTIAGTELMKVEAARITADIPLRLKGYTVATLPAGTVGDNAYVTDALAPTFLAAVVGGGAVVTPVFFNGSAWVGA